MKDTKMKDTKMKDIRMTLEMVRFSLGEDEKLNEIIKLVDKAIPMKLDYEATGYYDGELIYDMAYCPICRHEFEYEINDWGCDYCSDCGQALDWSEEEE